MGGQALIPELNHFDLFLTGGTILTGNPGQPEIRDGSIGVRDGKITWLGHGTPQSGHTTKRVRKLPGCVVTPGFVNTHTHSILTMVRGVAVDAGFAPSYTPGIPKGTVTLPKPMTSNSKAEGRFGKQDFRYLAEEDVYICPAGERLTYHYTNEENGSVLRRYWTNACQSCAIKHSCTTAKERRIGRASCRERV